MQSYPISPKTLWSKGRVNLRLNLLQLFAVIRKERNIEAVQVICSCVAFSCVVCKMLSYHKVEEMKSSEVIFTQENTFFCNAQKQRIVYQRFSSISLKKEAVRRFVRKTCTWPSLNILRKNYVALSCSYKRNKTAS